MEGRDLVLSPAPPTATGSKQNPERWAPQYGGYCAYGVAQGYAVKIEVDQWSVVDGKLYLNYSRSVQRTWKQDIPGLYPGSRTRTGRKC